MLIGLPIAILYFPERKITAEGAEEVEAFNYLFGSVLNFMTYE